MVAKPSKHLAWTVGNPDFGTVTQEPTDQKKQDGWLEDERPPHEEMNWLFWDQDAWNKYFEYVTDTFAGAKLAAVVGSGAGCTHATLALALADAGVTSKNTILLTEDFVLTTKVDFTKDNIKVICKPGVQITRSGASKGFDITANGVVIEGLRFIGFTTGNKAIDYNVGALYGRVTDCQFDADDCINYADANLVRLSNILVG